MYTAYGCSQINVLTFIVQCAHSVHTYRSFVHDFFKIYSVGTGCVQPKDREHITVFFDIVWKYVSRYRTCTYHSFVYDLFYIYSVGTGCVQPKERVHYCVFFILCGNMFLSQMALHICQVVQYSCTVILVTALAYANTAGSAVLLANYTLLFGKLMHLWIHVLIYALI